MLESRKLTKLHYLKNNFFSLRSHQALHTITLSTPLKTISSRLLLHLTIFYEHSGNERSKIVVKEIKLKKMSHFISSRAR